MEDKTNSSSPAFGVTPSDRGFCYKGLTKREYFAAMALQGLCAKTSYSRPDCDEVALEAVIIADALLKELEK